MTKLPTSACNRINLQNIKLIHADVARINLYFRIFMPIKRFLIPLFFVIPHFCWSSAIDSSTKKIQDLLDAHKVQEVKALLIPFEEAAQKEENSEMAWYYYHFQSQLFDGNNEFDKGQNYIQKEIEIARKLKRNDLLCNSLLNMGSHYEMVEDIANAIPYYLEVLDLLGADKKETEIAHLYNKLGLIFYADREYQTAIKYFLESYILFNRHKNERPVFAYWVQNNLGNIGLCYDRLHNYRKALFYTKIALKFCETAKFEQERPMGVLTTNIGAIYNEMGYPKRAIAYLKKGIKSCLDPANYELSHGTASLLTLAGIYSKTGEYKLADESLSIAYKLIIEKKFISLLPYYYKTISQHYENQKKFENAFIYQNKYYQINDSLNKVLEKSDYSKQILLYKLEKQKIENELLVQTNKIKTLQNKVILVFVIFTLLSFFYIWFNLKKSGKRNAELEILNKQITKQKNELEQLNQELERKNQNKSYLIQTVAHDLRTPIGNIQSLAGLMMENEDQNEEFNEYISLIDHSSRTAITIIEDILDQSAIERGQLNLDFKPVKIGDIIQESVQMLNFRLDPKSIQIKTVFEQNRVVQLDHERFKRVLLNIITNAIKFSPRNSIIEILQVNKPESILISIKDSGIGMDPNILRQIFEKNTSAGRTGLENEKTIGVGLSIAKTIIEGHHGKIWAESEPDKGSTFYIELPLEKEGV